MKNSYDFDWGNRETLGKGNFSTVFGITDRKTGIKYAVHTPIIKPNNDIEEWIKLQRNAQLVSNKIKSRINYPKIQIPKIYEVKEKTGTPLCIMEFIPNLEVGSPRLISNDNISSIVEFFNDLHQLPTKPFEKLFQHYKYRMIFKESSLMNSCGLTHLQDDILKPSVEKSICHGDTSPTNIGISNNKYVAILDWDLAQKNSFLSDIHHFTTDLSTSNSDLDNLILIS